MPIDGVLGLANGRADAFSDLGRIVRFNASSGASRCRQSLGQSYRVGMNINPSTGRYDVIVRARGGDTLLATAYAFRTEQAGATMFDQVRQFVDGQGHVNVCDVVVSY